MAKIIDPSITIPEILYLLSEGNPGAVTVLTSLLENNEKVDPDSAFGVLGTILYLDTFEIYGSEIWVLYKDICKENIVNVIGIIRAIQMGIISKDVVKESIKNEFCSFDVEEIVKKVKKVLPNFDKE